MKRLFNKLLILFFILSIESLEASKPAPRVKPARTTTRTIQPTWKTTLKDPKRRDAILSSLKTKVVKDARIADSKKYEANLNKVRTTRQADSLALKKTTQERLVAEASLQGEYIPVRFNKEKMVAKANEYREKVKIELERRYGKGNVSNEMINAFTADHINTHSSGYVGVLGESIGLNRSTLAEATGYSKAPLKIDLSQQTPNQQKLSSGIEAFNEARQDPKFNSKKYEQSAKTQILELQREFPHSSRAEILTFLTESLNHPASKFKTIKAGNKEIIMPRKGPNGEPLATITNRPELTTAEAWTPTFLSAQPAASATARTIRLQKMYDSMKVKESIAKNAKEAHVLSEVNPLSFMRKTYYEPQKVYNEAIRVAAETASSMAHKSLQPQVASTAPAFKLSPEARRAVEQLQKDVVTVGTEHAVRAVDGAAQGYGFKASVRSPQKFQQEAITKTAQEITKQLRTPVKANPKESAPLFTKRTEKAVAEATTAGLETLGILSPKPLVNRTPTTASRTIQKAFRDKQTRKKTAKIEAKRNQSATTAQKVFRGWKSRKKTTNTKAKTATAKSSVTTSSITGYFTTKFKKIAEVMPRTPEALKKLTHEITNAISNTFRLSKSDRGKLNKLGEREVEILIKDKNSWINTKPENFKPAFERWMRRFVGKCYKAIGRTKPTKAQIITINEHNPLSPKITLNTSASGLTSATITYEGRSYQGKVTQQPDGTYTITAPLKKNLSITAQLKNRWFKKKVTDPVMTSEAGLQLKAALPETTSMLTKKPSHAGDLLVTYNPTNQSIVTKVTTPGPNSSNIVTTKKYSKNGTKNITKQSETIAIEAIKEAQFSTSIQLSTNPNGVQSFNIAYINTQTGKKYEFKARSEDIVFDSSTGTYTIDAKFKAPEKLKPIQEVRAKVADSAWEGLVHGVENIYTGAVLKNQYREAYGATKSYLTGEYGTAINSVAIKYNPATKTIITKTTQTMSTGREVPTEATYSIS